MTSHVTSRVYSSTTSVVDEFERVLRLSSCVQGYYVYQDTWTPVISEQLVCRRADSNPHEFFLARFKISVQRHFTTYYQKEIISLEKFRGYQLFRKNRETFPPQTICNIRYIPESCHAHYAITLIEQSKIL